MLYRYLMGVLAAVTALGLVFLGAVGGCLGAGMIGEIVFSDQAAAVLVAIPGGIVGLWFGLLAASRMYARLLDKDEEP